MEALRQEVEKARKEYVMADYKQNRTWDKITKYFGTKNLKEGTEKSPDLVVLKQRYEEALTTLKHAELEALENSGLKGVELKTKLEQIVAILYTRKK